MCSSGAHYLDWEEIDEMESQWKIEKNGVNPKFICSYSGLLSVNAYMNKNEK